jgi:hypothetical protein
MMIDVDNESVITFPEAARALPNRPNLSTLWRWRMQGVRGIKLEIICIGGRTYTSREALARFLERVTAAKSGEPVPTRTNRHRQRDQRAARKQLAEAGLLD